MTASLARGCGLCLLLGASLLAAPALGDEVAGEAPTEVEMGAELERSLEPAPRENRSDGAEDAVEDWRRRRPWEYSTEYFFALSRGMDEAGVPRAARPALLLVALPLDLANLPFAAIAGLFGD